ncbi:Imm26 family immunity protein [Pseudomonas sp. Teo4]|uniref:Imm26 family immunity protein n=1 Tax=Pseudomonas sp. Teo4 TaxID=3064528 RepID=UPI002ABB69CC|nr:Imm26 family immunity protein [Pseudomonas sp. Teo4]MDZ3992296.1 hypothetical protein [Pseudomonas sp. Teo4]
MARQTVTIGSIVEIQLEESLYAYGQIVSRAEVAFFEPIGSRLNAKRLAEKPLKLLFVIGVMNKAITSGRWLKVSKGVVGETLLQPRDYFIVDQISGHVHIYRSDTGAIRPGTMAEANELECAAVWSAEHVEDRLRDHFHGSRNVWLESLREGLTIS